ncbi:AbrB/MazE/SpoVT family DNA-binding domain-containing protein [Bacillus sp. S2(2019)]|uniref:AbrB/MazE/SpoVT family DNA-binding domain-containing protein n=1 Tax=Bacillus TaxID=1386 RepID=UPI0009329F6D|nr:MULTISPECIES: AbrB/MazE/SpoVT family DNA-binding domain-containing protein [Bacillus]OJT56856.1 transition state regulator Abh [Bacillus licheniformis]TKD54549.1 AbrB/MazE/SpoVT family DNA-binding domain-containing protein [Bacillus sp. S2(2019)]
MKNTGLVRKLDQLGRIVLPQEMRKNLGIFDKDLMEISKADDKIILKKIKRNNVCLVTGIISDNNMRLSGGIVLSRTGAIRLLKELQQALDNDSSQ